MRRLCRASFQGRCRGAGRPRRDQVPTLPPDQSAEACEPFSERRVSSPRRRPLWLYVPNLTTMGAAICAASPSAPVMAASNSGLPLPSQAIELFVTSSGKPTLRPLSWRGWKTRPWSQRLFGTICDPSTADHGAAVYMSSLPAIPASPSASPENGAGSTIPVTYGPILSASSTRSGRAPSSPRMSKGTSIWDLPKSSAAYAAWVTAQKQDCSRRERWAQATGVAASSSWPTPTATDAGYLPDLMIADGQIQPKSPFDVAATSSGQFSLGNAARAWTKLWLTMRAMGWHPVTMPPSSHRVRVSFRLGSGSFIDGLISNPQFYELTMGWPIGWSAPGEPVTGFVHWKQRSRTELSRLISLGSAGNDA